MIRSCPSCSAQNRIPAKRLADQAKCGSCKAVLPAVDKPMSVTSAAEFDELLRESPLPVVVDFWAPWCGPCRTVAPELEKVAASHAGAVVVAKVNSDDLPEVAGRFAIRGIPAFIRFDGGKETKRATGAMPAATLVAALAL